MARIIKTTTWNLPHSIERAFPKPLDSTEIWYPSVEKDEKGNIITTTALDRAMAYAKSEKNTSYVGQILCVLEGILEGENLNFKGIKPEYYSIQLDNDGKGELVPLFDESLINKITNNQNTTLEIDYENNLIKEEGYTIILAPGLFKQDTSTLFINGLQSNRSEYYEGYYDGKTFEEKSIDHEITDELGNKETIKVCNAIKFDKFELDPGTIYDNRRNNGDEIIMNATFIEDKKE